MSNLLLEKYLEAADKIVPAAFANTRRARPPAGLRPGPGRGLRGSALAAFAERAFRRPVADADLAPYLGLIELARAAGRRPRGGAAAGHQGDPRLALLPLPDRAGSAPGDHPRARRLRGGLAPVVLPLEQHAGRRAVRAGPRPARSGEPDEIGDPGRGACWPIRKAAALIDNLAGQWLYTRQIPELNPDPELLPGGRVRRGPARGDAAGDPPVPAGDPAGRPQRARPAAGRLHLRQPPPGPALRPARTPASWATTWRG